MPSPFELEGKKKGVFDFVPSTLPQHQWPKEASCFTSSTEPTSVLDSRRSPSPSTSSSTFSSSLGSNAGGSTGGVAGKCGIGMEDWESVLPEFAASPGKDQSVLRCLMGDIETLNSSTFRELDFYSSLEETEQTSMFGSINPLYVNDFRVLSENLHLQPSSNSILPLSVPQQSIFPPQTQNQDVFGTNLHSVQPSQNPLMFLPLPFSHPEQNLDFPSPPKRLNTGTLASNYHPSKVPFMDSRQEFQPHGFSTPLQFLPNHLHYKPTASKQNTERSEEMNQNQQQAILELIFKAVELVEMGNAVLAQGILARLNQHQLSPIGKPFQRVAFYFKECLQSLLPLTTSIPTPNSSPFNLILKIGAFKSFSEISPLVHFGNFTCNQAIIEGLKGFDRIHIVDFDIGYGYGCQWASLMQELACKNGNVSLLKITAFVSSLSNCEIELGLTREILTHFASEIKLPFELDILSFDSLGSLPHDEAIAVNLGTSAFSNHPALLPMVLHFLKQLSPKIVVFAERGFERTEFAFPQNVVQAFQSFTTLLASLDAVNPNPDTIQKIERLIVQPEIEKVVLGRLLSPEKTLPWRSLLLSAGFSPLQFSNFAESQAECLAQRTPVRGFQVEKRQSSLALCWHQKDLILVSAWKC